MLHIRSNTLVRYLNARFILESSELNIQDTEHPFLCVVFLF